MGSVASPRSSICLHENRELPALILSAVCNTISLHPRGRHSLSQLSDDEDDAQNGEPSSKDRGRRKGEEAWVIRRLAHRALLLGGGLCQEIDISGVLLFVVVSLLSLYLLALTGAM